MPRSATPDPPEPALRVVVGGRVRKARTDRGWSLRHLAAEAGLAESWVRSVESGNVSVGIERLATICKALDLTIGEITAPQ